jgi:hypothetical protein
MAAALGEGAVKARPPGVLSQASSQPLAGLWLERALKACHRQPYTGSWQTSRHTIVAFNGSLRHPLAQGSVLRITTIRSHTDWREAFEVY